MALRDSEIRALRALRAGPLTRCQAEERWPSVGQAPLYSLSRAGLAAYDGAHFTITDAGRAACPFNNPILAARAAGKPKEKNIMPRNRITRSDVFDAICAAGPDGTTVKALAERLVVSTQTVFNHLKHLTREPGAVVRRPRHGVLVASRFLEGAPESADDPAVAEVPEEEVAKIARQFDEMIDFDLEAAQSVDATAQRGAGAPSGMRPRSGMQAPRPRPQASPALADPPPGAPRPTLRGATAQRGAGAPSGMRPRSGMQAPRPRPQASPALADPPPGAPRPTLRGATAQPPSLGEAASLAAVNKMLDALPKLGSEDPANRHGVTPTAPAPFSEDIELDDPEQVEFAIFSSGGLDMYTDQGNVTLRRDVLRKLRAFLGLFAEGA